MSAIKCITYFNHCSIHSYMFDGDLLKNIFKMDGFLKDISKSICDVHEGYIEIEVPIRDNVMRVGGIMNGGAIMSISDAIGGLSMMTYGDVINQVTVNLNTDFIKPVKNGPARFICKVERKGKTLGYSKIEVFDSNMDLCAVSIGVYFLYH